MILMKVFGCLLKRAVHERVFFFVVYKVKGFFCHLLVIPWCFASILGPDDLYISLYIHTYLLLMLSCR